MSRRSNDRLMEILGCFRGSYKGADNDVDKAHTAHILEGNPKDYDRSSPADTPSFSEVAKQILEDNDMHPESRPLALAALTKVHDAEVQAAQMQGRWSVLKELRQWMILNHDNRGMPIPWADMYQELRSEIIDKLRTHDPDFDPNAQLQGDTK